ncbi:MAG: efflux RND transporter periplasmic adaptor subunit [Gemmatimonadota bacterium]
MSVSTRLVMILGCASLAAGCAEEVRSDRPDGSDDPTAATRRSVAVASPAATGGLAFQTNLYSERDADLYNRLMIEETSRGGIPITAIRVEVGNRVQAGQLLATLEDSDARLYVEAAEPEAEVAASNLARMEELKKSGAVSQAEYDDAVYANRTAEAAVKQARLNLSRTEIRAPFAGIVSRRYVRVGDIVDDEMPLFRVTAMAPLRARLQVPESEIGSFRTGTPVSISAADGSTGTAKVIIVGPTIDAGSGTREVIVELAQVGDFRPGASVTAELVPPPNAERVPPRDQKPTEPTESTPTKPNPTKPNPTKGSGS